MTSSVYACPVMSGKYSCPDPRGGNREVIIEQDGQQFFIQGLDPFSNLIADGLWHDVTDSSQYQNARYKATCLQEKVIASVRGDLFQNSLYLGKANVEITLEKLSGGNLKRKIHGKIQGPFMQIPVSDEATCLKKIN